MIAFRFQIFSFSTSGETILFFQNYYIIFKSKHKLRLANNHCIYKQQLGTEDNHSYEYFYDSYGILRTVRPAFLYYGCPVYGTIPQSFHDDGNMVTDSEFVIKFI